MQKKYLSLFLIVFFNFFIKTVLSAQVQYEHQVVEKIDIHIHAPTGSEVDSSSVLSRMKTKKGDFFSQTDFDSDLKTLAQDFDRVEPSFEILEGTLEITLNIWPKPTIRTICWKGNKQISTKDLQKQLDIASCTVFDRQAFNKAFNKVRGHYITKGFFEAELSYDVAYDSLTNVVDIDIQINEGRAGKIKNIVFANFTQEEKDDILEMMLTKQYNFFTSWYTNEGIFNEEAVQHDKFVILNYLQNEGYADAKVEIEVCEACQQNRITIQIVALKGEPFYFGKLSIEGNKLYCDDEIWKLFTFEEGDLYCPDDIRNTVEKITNYYGRRGYIDAIIDFEPRLSGECQVYDISFHIDEGDQYRVGLIKVFGNCSTQTNVILHESFIVPGEIFNNDKLKLTEMKLQNIGYFENVNVYAVKSEGSCGLGDNYRDVHIEVEETSTGKFGAFFGFSTVENMFGGLNITENNFNYKGIGRFWQEGYKALRGGGEFAHVTATIGAKSRSYVLSWTKPFFRDTQWVIGFDLENSTNRYISDDYTIDSNSFNLHATYPLNAYLKLGLHYRLKYTDVVLSKEGKRRKKEKSQSESSSAPSSSSSSSEEIILLEESSGSEPNLIEESKNDGIISAVGASLIYDSTDNPGRPTTGTKSRLEGEIAGLGGKFCFLGAAYLNSAYFRIARKGILKLRADFRFVFTYDGTDPQDLPIDERLFLGGDSIVRGYRPYKLGPQFPIDKQPRGGLSMQLLSIEYTHSFLKRVDGFLFCDSGHLSFKEMNFGRLSTAVGGGLRIQVFAGGPPVNVGMGYPINPRNRSEVKRFFLTIGGKF